MSKFIKKNEKNIKSMIEISYDKVYKEYLSLEKKKGWPRLKWLKKILIHLKPDSSALDLGCGLGDPIDIEISKKHNIIGVDISKNMIKLAHKNVPNGNYIHNDLSKLSFLPGSFDAIVAFYTIEHIPRKNYKALLQQIHKWLGEPMFLSCYDPNKTIKIVKEAGFNILDKIIESQIEGENEVPYLWILASK